MNKLPSRPDNKNMAANRVDPVMIVIIMMIMMMMITFKTHFQHVFEYKYVPNLASASGPIL